MDIEKKNNNLIPEHICVEPDVGENLILKYPNSLSEKDKKKFESHLKVCPKCQEECKLEKFALEQFKYHAPDIISERIFESVQHLLKKEQYGEVTDKFIRVFGLDAFKKVLLFPFSFLRSNKPREALKWIIETLDRLAVATKKPALVYEAPVPSDEKGGIFTSAILYLVNTLSNYDISDDERKRIAEKVILTLKEENKKHKSSSDSKKG